MILIYIKMSIHIILYMFSAFFTIALVNFFAKKSEKNLENPLLNKNICAIIFLKTEHLLCGFTYITTKENDYASF